MPQQLTTNSDKKSVCLVCKELQGLVTPLLYRHMVVASRFVHDRYEEVFTASHSGLAHVKTLHVIKLESDDILRTWEELKTALTHILRKIPENTLKRLD